MLGIRGILVRIRIRGSIPDPDPDPTPNLTPFFSDFKDAKKIIVAGSYVEGPNTINKLSQRLFSRVLASYAGGPGSIPRRDMSALGPLD